MHSFQYKETRRRLFLVTGDLSSLAIGEEEWRGIFLIGLRKEGENVNISSQFSDTGFIFGHANVLFSVKPTVLFFNQNFEP